MNLSDKILDKITLLVQNEIDKKVDEHMTKYIQYISKKYHIPVTSLMADKLNSTDNVQEEQLDINQCNGFTAKGKRCKSSAKKKGYCKRHEDQYVPIQKAKSVEDMNAIKHTHTLPPMFLAGCPACESKKISYENTLIGL